MTAARGVIAVVLAALAAGTAVALAVPVVVADQADVLEVQRVLRQAAAQASGPGGAAERVVRAAGDRGLPDGVTVLVAPATTAASVAERPGTSSTPPTAPAPSAPPIRVATGEEVSRAVEQDGALDTTLRIAGGPDQVRLAVSVPQRGSTLPAVAAAVTVLGVLLGGVVVAVGRRTPPNGRATAPEPQIRDRPGGEPSRIATTSPGPAPGADHRRAGDDAALRGLVDEVLDLVPQLPEALAWRAERALERVGVQSFRSDGQPFDPGLHESVGVAPAPAGADAGTVAATHRAGYRTSDAVLRPALVVVYGPVQGPSARTAGS